MRIVLVLVLVLAPALAPALAQGGGSSGGGIHAADKQRDEIKKELAPKARDGDLGALKRLVEYLSYKHPLPRDDAFSALIDCTGEKCVDAIIGHLLAEGSADTRADLIEVLYIQRAERALPALAKLAKSDEKNKPLILFVLGEMGSKEHAEVVAGEAKKAKERARAEAIEALARLDPEAAKPIARACTTSADFEVRVAGLRALQAIDEDGAFEGALANLKERAQDQAKKKKGRWQPAYMSMKVLLSVRDRAKRVEGYREAIDQLVALLEHEKGRMKHEVGETLRSITGKPDLEDDFTVWSEWWKVIRERFTPKDAAPPPTKGDEGDGEKPGKKPYKPRKKKGEDDAASGGKKDDPPAPAPEPPSCPVGTSVRFHGIPIYSDRVAFIIDLSGSMNNEMPVKEDEPPPPPPEKGTGEREKGGTGSKGQKTKKKLDVSKEELIKTIGLLPEELWFNIVSFGTDVKIWSTKGLVQALKSAKAAATDYVKAMKIEGRTNFYGALSKPLEDPLVDTVYFLSDGGMTTEGKYIDQRRIVRKIHELNKYALVEYNCLLFGAEDSVSDSALRWMKSIAETSGGKFYIKP